MISAPKRIAPDLAWRATGISNVYFLGRPGGKWVLVDTGPRGHAKAIKAAAKTRFGGVAPAAILLTHGHPDHSGNAAELADYWRVPIYADRLELPYLTGVSTYPPADPSVGGFIGIASVFLHAKGCDLGNRVQPLPENPDFLPGWSIIPTPGHSPGQIALFRESDRTLIAGDAFATVDMTTFSSFLRKRVELSPGLIPFNYDWKQTLDSARKLADLRPQVIGAGHGVPILPPGVPDELADFVDSWHPPERGRYVREAARVDENGVVSLPPAIRFAWLRVAWKQLFAVGGTAGAAAWMISRHRKRPH